MPSWHKIDVMFHKVVMKKSFLTLAFALAAGFASAQQDSIIHDAPEPQLPQGQYGTQRVPQPAGGDLKEDRVEVGRDQLPPAMLEELNGNIVYEGWESGNIYYEKNTDQFIVHVVKDNTTHTFRFDKEGRAVRTAAPLDSPGNRQ